MYQQTVNKINHYFEKGYIKLARKSLPKLISDLNKSLENDWQELQKLWKK